MATTISVKNSFGLLTTETLDSAAVPGLRSQDVIHNGFLQRFTLDGTTTPAVSVISEQSIASSANGTINLAALPITNNTYDATGKKLKEIYISNLGTHTFSLVVGASNGYVVGGVTIACPAKTGTIPGLIQINWGDTLAAIDSSHRTLDYTFNAGDAGPVHITMILG